jgi:hypothetical protein
MPASFAATALVSLVILAAADKPQAAPQKQSWESTNPVEAQADFLPQAALIEVDGQPRGSGFVKLEVTDLKRTYRFRVTAEGFEAEEAVVEAGRIASKQFYLALRPVGFEGKLDSRDAGGMARAASLLWKAGRVDDAAAYAGHSLRVGNTPLANRVMGDVWRLRGKRDLAVKHFTMYLSLTDNPPDAAEIKAWLLQDRPGDITVP